MRHFILGLIVAAGFGLATMGAASAEPAGTSVLPDTAVSGGIVHQAEWGYCDRLRRACMYKNERGEEGQGNCRRYHDECGQRTEESRCERLRHECREAREAGYGDRVCERYRDECRR